MLRVLQWSFNYSSYMVVVLCLNLLTSQFPYGCRSLVKVWLCRVSDYTVVYVIAIQTIVSITHHTPLWPTVSRTYPIAPLIIYTPCQNTGIFNSLHMFPHYIAWSCYLALSILTARLVRYYSTAITIRSTVQLMSKSFSPLSQAPPLFFIEFFPL